MRQQNIKQYPMNRKLVVLGLAQLSVPQKIEFARFVVTSMTGNANFGTPSPTLASVTTNINALETAYVAARGGGHDETTAMHAKELLLELSLKALAGYVEPIANANPVNAEAIITSAGMRVKKGPAPKENGFRIALNGNVGEVLLRTDFESRAAFRWQKSLTPYVESSWMDMHLGTQASYVATGLTSGTVYYFRVAKIDRHGQNDWSMVRYIMVI